MNHVHHIQFSTQINTRRKQLASMNETTSYSRLYKEYVPGSLFCSVMPRSPLVFHKYLDNQTTLPCEELSAACVCMCDMNSKVNLNLPTKLYTYVVLIGLYVHLCIQLPVLKLVVLVYMYTHFSSSTMSRASLGTAYGGNTEFTH